MIGKLTLLHKYKDVHVWLDMLSNRPDSLLVTVTDNARVETSEHFKIPNDEVDNLTLLDEDNYTDEEGSVLNFYFECLRKIHDSRK